MFYVVGVAGALNITHLNVLAPKNFRLVARQLPCAGAKSASTLVTVMYEYINSNIRVARGELSGV